MPSQPPESAVVDAVIVTWNSGPDLPTCLAALPSFVRPIVVDNGSADDGVAIARAAGIEEIALGENRGFPAAVNVGLERVTSDFTLLLNPDVVVGEGAVERCLAVIAGDASIGLVGPNTLDSDGHPEPPAARRDRRASHILLESLTLTRLHPWFDRQTIRDRAQDLDVDAVNGAFMLVRRRALDEVGAFDEGYWMYMEDLDLNYRLAEAGWKTWYEPAATAIHVKAGTSGEVRGLRLNRAFHYGMFRFYRDHYAATRSPLTNAAVYAGIAGKLAVSAVRSAVGRTADRF